MRLVGTNDPQLFAPVVAANSLNESSFVFAHSDGTISVVANGELSWIWLNPQRRVLTVTGFDQSVFVSFDDSNCEQFSLNTGLKMHSTSVVTKIEQVAVFEQIIVGWSPHDLLLTLFYRFNLEPFADLLAESFIVNVFRAQNRVLVVCAAHIYELKLSSPEKFSYSWEMIYSIPEKVIVDAQPFEKFLCLVSSRSWGLAFVNDEGKLEYTFEVDAPSDSMLKQAHVVTNGIAIVSETDKMVVMHHNNIQLIDLPFEKHNQVFSMGNSGFISDQMETFRLFIDGSEFKWEKTCFPFKLASHYYLVGETDPNLTAKSGELRGYANGFVNNSLVFPGPVLKIDDQHVYSHQSFVRLPLTEVKLISPSSLVLNDARVSTPVSYCSAETYQQFEFIGTESPDRTYWALQPLNINGAELPPSLAVALIDSQCLSVSEALQKMSDRSFSILTLENMAIYARRSGDFAMLTVVTSLLSKLWSSNRVAALLSSSNARSIRVLASVIGYVSLSDAAFIKGVTTKLDSAEVCVCDAILEVFELNIPLMADLPLPFGCLEFVSPPRIRQFAQKMVGQRGSRILKFIADGLHTTTKPPNYRRSTASLAALMLLECLSLNLLPHNETELTEIVRMVLPTLRSRVVGAKEVLVKLISCHKLMYHKISQRLLVHTPENAEFRGLVFDMKANGGNAEYRLKTPAQEVYSINFGSDGSSVIGIGPHVKVMWTLARKTFNFFGAPSNEVDPQTFC